MDSSMGMSRVSTALINVFEEVQRVCMCVKEGETNSTAIMKGRMTYRQRADTHDGLFHTLMEDGHRCSD